jgi:hypothetical protein
MKARAGSGWQTLLADLAIILFMVTASALSQNGEEAQAASSPRGEPVAVYRAGPDAPPLEQWLAGQGADARQQLTIVAHYPAGMQAAALAEAGTLLRAAGRAGLHARLVVEPGEGGTVATLAYDAALAQGLQSGGGTKEPSR